MVIAGQLISCLSNEIGNSVDQILTYLYFVTLLTDIYCLESTMKRDGNRQLLVNVNVMFSFLSFVLLTEINSKINSKNWS